MIRLALNIPSEASVLDVGCGTGYFTRRFALDQTGTAAGIDPDEDAIGFARRHPAVKPMISARVNPSPIIQGLLAMRFLLQHSVLFHSRYTLFGRWLESLK